MKELIVRFIVSLLVLSVTLGICKIVPDAEFTVTFVGGAVAVILTDWAVSKL